jgi:peptidoglycan/LPS O-acetylase OafA/YrhL
VKADRAAIEREARMTQAPSQIGRGVEQLRTHGGKAETACRGAFDLRQAERAGDAGALASAPKSVVLLPRRLILGGETMGGLRLYLAICVAVTHYAPHWRPSWIAFSFVAVILFYIVSGFYMSLILAEKYQRRTGAFFLNRALRLFPPYYAALLVMALMSWNELIPGMVLYAGHLTPHWIFDQLTVVPGAIWQNLTLTMGVGRIMMGDFYTVGLEMIFYALAPLLVLLRTRTLLLMLPFALIVHFTPAYLALDQRPWQYDFFPALFVFFLMGCLSYRLYAYVKPLRPPRWAGYAVLPVILALILLNRASDWTNAPAPWAIYAAVALGIPFLFLATKSSRWDQRFGNLAYPLYLVHRLAIWGGQATVAAGTPFEWVVVMSLMVLFSAGLWLLVDRPIEWLRDKIAGRSADHLRRDAGARDDVGVSAPVDPRYLDDNRAATGLWRRAGA